MNRIRILLLDSQVLFRESIGRLLGAEPDLEITAECGSAPEAVAALQAQAADVMVLGEDVSYSVGAEIRAAALSMGQFLRFIVLSSDLDGGHARAALRAGASGIFLRHTSAAALLRAIRQVAMGDIWLDPQLIVPLTEVDGMDTPPKLQDKLTGREKDVLDGLLEGLSNRAIGERLGVTEGAVKAALHRVFEKAQVRTRGQLVRLVVERGKQRK